MTLFNVFRCNKRKTGFWVRAFLIVQVALALAFVACSTEGDTIYMPDPADQPVIKPTVTVVYGPESLGDRAFSDLIYQGVEQAALRHGLLTKHVSPLSSQAGADFIKLTLQQMGEATDTVRRLLIVASTIYDACLRQNNQLIAPNSRADLLYFEPKKPLDGKGSTLFMPYYGAMYEAGAILCSLTSHLLFIGSNTVDGSIADALAGLTAGFATSHVAAPANNGKRQLETSYLSDKAGMGYKTTESAVMKLLSQKGERNQTIIPVCGDAANSFYRLADIFVDYDFSYVGVDEKHLSSRCPLSVLKHADRAVVRCIEQWLSAEGMPKHQVLGMAEGFTEVSVHPLEIDDKATLDKALANGRQAVIHDEAVEKENAYEQK